MTSGGPLAGGFAGGEDRCLRTRTYTYNLKPAAFQGRDIVEPGGTERDKVHSSLLRSQARGLSWPKPWEPSELCFLELPRVAVGTTMGTR